MNWKITAAMVSVLAVCLLALVFILKRDNSAAPIQLTLRIIVEPESQIDLVIQEATAAKFKYQVGKKSGTKPAFAQKLSLTPVPNTRLVEAKLGLASKEEATRYTEAFLQILQAQCAGRARVSLVDQTIR